MIYSFKNDYSKICHKDVLNKLTECLNEQNVGYGEDIHTLKAKELIKNKIKHDSDIYFLSGGTITNMIAISSVLKPYEAVICCDTGHINVHETGAIEGQGHKVLSIKSNDGKLNIDLIDDVINKHIDHHMVKPKMIYISNTTELGGYYTLKELEELSKYSKDHDLYLYLDGARLASALAISDIDYSDYSRLTDMFYIGGTKNGSYFGEALIINNDLLKKEFNYNIKHFGGMLAKGFVTAIPFEVLMDGDLYINIGKHQNDMAKYLTDELKKLNIKFYSESETNQVFVYLKNNILDELYKDFLFEEWDKSINGYTSIRFVTSFDTEKKHIDLLIKRISELL